MSKSPKDRWRRPVNRVDVVVAAIITAGLVCLAALSAAGFIGERWILIFLLVCLTAPLALLLLSRLLARLILWLMGGTTRQRRRRALEKQMMQRTGVDTVCSS